SPETAEAIWTRCNELLQKDEFRARGLIERSNVKVICTTDDPTDSLEYHLALAEDQSFPVKVFPAFRPDKSFNLDKPGFTDWIAKLEAVVGKKIDTLANLQAALRERIEYFHSVGC